MPEAEAAEPGPRPVPEKATAIPAPQVPPMDAPQIQTLPMDVPPIPATGEPERTQPEKVPVESPGLLSDCRLMLSYARKNGLEIPAELLYEISWLDGVLATLNISPISAISTALLTPLTKEEISKGFRPRATVPGTAVAVPAPPPVRQSRALPPGVLQAGTPPDPVPSSLLELGETSVVVTPPAPVPSSPEDIDVAPPAADGLSPEEMVLKVHAELSTLIAPTTALSLQTSEPPPGKAHMFGGMPPLVQNIIWVALASAFFFIVSAAFIAHEAGTAKDAAKAAAEAASAAAALKASQPAQPPSAAAPKSEPGASK